MQILFIDTETTKFKKKGDLVQPGQARVCQVALILSDKETGRTISEFSSLVKPDDWEISEGANKIHGFTNEMCERDGIPMADIIPVYDEMMFDAYKVVAHGTAFDRGMMEIEYAYNKCEHINRDWFCTMTANKHLNGGKFASLETCMQHYCGRSVGVGAHNAEDDVKALRDIYFGMMGIKL